MMEYDSILYESDQRPFLKDEVSFYENLVKELRPKTILELGVGTGRIFSKLLPNVEYGVGIDISEQMLETCKEFCSSSNNYDLFNQSFVDFNLKRTFDLIYIPFNTFQHLLKEDEQMSCLKSVAAHMHENSHFVLDVMNSEQAILNINDEWKPDYSSVLQDGSKIERYQKTIGVERDTSIVHKVFMYKEIRDGQTIGTREFDALMKITPNGKLQEIIVRSGLNTKDIWSDYFFGHDNATKKKIYFLQLQ